MSQSRPFRRPLTLLIIGLASVLTWTWLLGRAESSSVASPRLLYALLLAGITAACVLLRFSRWQFLLRRMEVRIPARRSLSIYLASLAGIATPAYVGELSRALLVRRESRRGIKAPLAVVVFERLIDVAAIATLGAVVSDGRWTFLTMVAVVVVATLLGSQGHRLTAQGTQLHLFLSAVAKPRVLLFCYAISFASWAIASLAITLAAAAVGVNVEILDGVQVFTSATLLGGISLLPAGVAVTGSLAIVQLQSLGIALADAVLITSVFRFGTIGITLLVAMIFVVREWRVIRRGRVRTGEHFDEIADEYIDQFAPHIWDLLLGRKLGLVTEALPRPAAAAGLGLDLGCGLGHQCRWLRERGYQVIGLDYSYGLLKFARENGGAVVNASATTLPFANESLDFVYTVGVLHHLPTRADQRTACAEIARVLKPGGMLLVHETNPRNPLFRFYMGYVFPILRTIDEGTERWLLPRRWQNTPSLELVGIRYFTFLPDFVPRKLMRFFLALERWLERSPVRAFSVHYMAILRKPGEATSAAPVRGAHREFEQVST